VDDSRRRDFSILIGERGRDHYLSVFERIESGRPINPNIWAGLFGILWMLHRKLVLGAFVVYIPLTIVGYLILHGYYDTHQQLADNWPLLFVFPHVALFLVGNNIFYLRCRRMMLRQDMADGRFGGGQRIPALMWRGGTMDGLPWLVYATLFGTYHAVFIFWFVKSPVYFARVQAWFDMMENTVLH
jgi:hypothetical protein